MFSLSGVTRLTPADHKPSEREGEVGRVRQGCINSKSLARVVTVLKLTTKVNVHRYHMIHAYIHMHSSP